MGRILLAALVCATVVGCGPESEPEPIVSDPLDPSTGGEGEVILPTLRRLGRFAPGRYLFAASSLGGEGDELRPADLIEVHGDVFVVSVDGGPHRELRATEAWPHACLRAPVDFEEGRLHVHLDEGAPVLVLASSSAGARVSVALHMEHSEVVHSTAIVTDECPRPALTGRDARVADVEEGDRACLFADQETLDEAAGLAIPSGVGATVREEEGDWVHARVELSGGWANGWIPASLLAAESSRDAVRWDDAAIQGGRCVFPGRSDREANVDPLELEEDPSARPMIPPENIERVLRQGEPQIRACYDARLNEVPDLAVDLSITLLVDPDGRVDQVAVTRGANADEGLTRCVREVAGRWRFYPPRVGAVELSRSYRLRPPEPTEADEP